ncbi:hypothetical protein HANVADRAFT_62565 [Hanseniaspora valbyensis NRRL Y-1626]|uniref:Uncharacterized protein n=1 Tax=Hanseniaspora valbyensis NRRL Y-1626 TaxID=766949 RepID=A0A1B7TDK8_9ASCO|nr:hypothetical protein HANVADRAFT_62565 [Hanseniaspora valbyensis NRRL Y-1626]
MDSEEEVISNTVTEPVVEDTTSNDAEALIQNDSLLSDLDDENKEKEEVVLKEEVKEEIKEQEEVKEEPVEKEEVEEKKEEVEEKKEEVEEKKEEVEEKKEEVLEEKIEEVEEKKEEVLEEKKEEVEEKKEEVEEKKEDGIKPESVETSAQPVADTKEQIRLKKLEQARKKIERLKNKKKQNAKKATSVEITESSTDINLANTTPINENTNEATPSSILSPTPQIITRDSTSNNDTKINELNNTIGRLNKIIEEKNSEIKSLKIQLAKQQQQQIPPNTSSPYVPQIQEQYPEINFNDWKNYTLDMSTWRSIGSGPIVQF